MTEEKQIRVHCNRCGPNTKHTMLFRHQTEGSDSVSGVGDIWWTDLYELLECNGCEAVTLRHSHYFSEVDDTTVYYYPPRASRRVPKWTSKLPWDLSRLLREAYVALYADSLRLAVMGARAVLDMVLLDTVGDVGSFQQKLSELEAKGFVASQNREYLEVALDVGSAAMHRGHVPNAEEAGNVLDILENLLEAVYVLSPVASKLKKGTPPRPKRKKA